MRAVVQRVVSASVLVGGKRTGEIGNGLLVLLGAKRGDRESDAKWLANRIAGLRIFNDREGKMNLALQDVGGSVLVVSNFTVYGDASRGRRPSFTDAAPYQEGMSLYERFCVELSLLGVTVEKGVYGADMTVSLANSGPVTVIVDSPDALTGAETQVDTQL